MKNNISNSTLYISIIASLMVVLKMYSGNNIYLVIFLIITLTSMVITAPTYRIEYLLFFVSWIYVLKFDFSQFSLFILLSAFYILINIVHIFRNEIRLSKNLIISFLIFSYYVIFVSFIKGGEISIYLGFLINFIVLFFAVVLVNKETNYYRYIRMYAWGLFFAGCVRVLSYYIGEINQYIEIMTRINTVKVSGVISVRFSGLDLDPNYFAVQILISVSTLLVIAFYAKKISSECVFLLLILSLFGIMTFSKMFIITFALLTILATLSFFKSSVRAGISFSIGLILFGIIGYVYLFEYFYSVYWVRFFGVGSSIEALTTGRSEIWIMFRNEILNNFSIFLFGAGYGTEFLGGRIAHNMYLTVLYYMGILGSIISIFYFMNLYSIYKKKIDRASLKNIPLFSVNYIPIYILLISNIALDSFMMDFFPIQIFILMSSLLIIDSEFKPKLMKD